MEGNSHKITLISLLILSLLFALCACASGNLNPDSRNYGGLGSAEELVADYLGTLNTLHTGK